jgi:hypothetical protein
VACASSVLPAVQLAGAFAPLVNPAKSSRRTPLPSSNAASPPLFKFWRAFHQSIKTYNSHDENAYNQRKFTTAFKKEAQTKSSFWKSRGAKRIFFFEHIAAAAATRDKQNNPLLCKRAHVSLRSLQLHVASSVF